jgi:hypothetical protein
MCKHVNNCQVYMYAPCCKIWVECSECHDEMQPDHQFQFDRFMKFTCKVCRKRFDRDFGMFSEKDKKCNFCGTTWCLPAETPESKLYKEARQVMADQMIAQIDQENPYFNELPN